MQRLILSLTLLLTVFAAFAQTVAPMTPAEKAMFRQAEQRARERNRAVAVTPQTVSYIAISAATSGGDWPFIVPDGLLECRPWGQYHLIVFTALGIEYAINGTAKSHLRELKLRDSREIWKRDPNHPNQEIRSNILQKGLALCAPRAGSGRVTSSPAVMPSASTTKAGHIACTSKENLDLLIRASNAKDSGTVEAFFRNQRCIFLKGGLTVTVVDWPGLFGGTTSFLVNGFKLWTVREAINY